ncbi:hypothetical protein F2Q68_00033505 [Brassica cretica]|uniref:Uncharacterized protein n=1 Tax=Brassica cretica TaxID=69181 RepID=A0A8S9H5X0_BRACR|nr:hypothetical protein F2Q68_00033505 [Brassica cretica]
MKKWCPAPLFVDQFAMCATLDASSLPCLRFPRTEEELYTFVFKMLLQPYCIYLSSLTSTLEPEFSALLPHHQVILMEAPRRHGRRDGIESYDQISSTAPATRAAADDDLGWARIFVVIVIGDSPRRGHREIAIAAPSHLRELKDQTASSESWAHCHSQPTKCSIKIPQEESKAFMRRPSWVVAIFMSEGSSASCVAVRVREVTHIELCLVKTRSREDCTVVSNTSICRPLCSVCNSRYKLPSILKPTKCSIKIPQEESKAFMRRPSWVVAILMSEGNEMAS